ncbi:hypothetical protein AVEN_134665-1 [Araneus ventricosus]|uniref:Uncharacterized protein n=1 Tax=Araneus ventricosus TaxID=182803 RepID=A0A4Y2F2S3_ARAVE|nr:hypothetical protein AVEN_134665-1 [Araneus ventricosus]
MRGYPEHGPNQKQGTPVTSAKVQPAIVSATEPPPAFLADYEEQDFAAGDFGIQEKEDDIPTKSAGEYPDSAAGTTGSTSHNDQHPETTVSKETSSAIHPNVQEWFDSLAENAEKFDAENIASFRGVPGVNFPDYEDIPVTPFTCFDKPYLPGFYADMDTGCQVILS